MSFTVATPLQPETFQGRQQTIQQVSARLAHPNFQSTCLAGGPTTGKTSLLRFLAQSKAIGDQPGFKGRYRVFFQGESVGFKMKPAGFWAGVLKDLLAQVEANAALKAVVNPALERARKGEIDIYDLEDVFEVFGKANSPVVLFVDDFDNLLRNENFWPPDDFFHHVRSLAQSVPRGLAFVITTPRALIDLWDPTRAASPFYNIFDNLLIGRIDEDEARAFVKNGFQALGLVLDAAVADQIVAIASGHPCLLNFVADVYADSFKNGKPVDALLNNAFQDPNGLPVTLNRQIRAQLSVFEKTMVDSLEKTPDALTVVQREQLRKLHGYGLLRPGLKLP